MHSPIRTRRFEEPLEDAFRASRRETETRLLISIAAVAAAAVTAFVPADLRLVESATLLAAVLVARAVTIASSVGLVFVALACRSHSVRDRWVVAWVAAFVTLDLLTTGTRPPGFSGYVAISPIVVLACYTAVPGPPAALGALAMLESVGILAIAVRGGLSPSTLFSLTIALTVANVLGRTVMNRLRGSDREQFLALRAQTEARAALEAAIAEIRTLRGIVPICSVCKQVRDDDGFWRQVEVYVAEHSEAEFSHGLCPTCVEPYLAETGA